MAVSIIKEDGKVVYDVSRNNEWYSQRNNAYVYDRGTIHLTGYSFCNVTSYAQWSDIMGIKIPVVDKALTQDEDQLAKFICTSPECDAYYKKINLAEWQKWHDAKAPAKEIYAPTEIHDVLCYGYNLLIGKPTTKFTTAMKIQDMFNEILIKGRPVICSVRFGGLGHIVVLVGLEYKNTGTPESSIKNLPINIVIDDPYGYFNQSTQKYEVISGNNVRIPLAKFYSDFKGLGDKTTKWAHYSI
jgi:hypothetical protein